MCKRTQHVTPKNVGGCWPTMLCLFAQGLREFCKSRSWPAGCMDHFENEIGFFKEFSLKIQSNAYIYSGIAGSVLLLLLLFYK